MKRRFVLPLLLFAACAPTVLAQTPAPTPTPQATPTPAAPPAAAPQATAPAANPADVASVDSILAALYDVISGPAGKKRDWDRFRSLFAPGARLIPTFARRPPGTAPDAPLTGKEEYGARAFTPDEYMERSRPILEGQGFFEREVTRHTEQFGHILHAFSTYEARHKAEDAKPFLRGINSIQLMNDGKRWWIVTVFWEAESAQTPLPEKYLKSDR
ncbi:MAG TPA: hypothetical protein VJ715_11575 [Pyrinomonadaceae bacterium]|nr:hypothetical protein [Pyrinomonadaceae bacterium]